METDTSLASPESPDLDKAVENESEEKSSKSTSFKDEVDEMGLNPEYWVKIFNKLGFVKKQQLQYLDETSLKILLSNTQFEWEKTFFRKLFIDHHKNENVFEKLRKKLPDTRTHIREAFKSNTDRRKAVFDENTWVKTFESDKKHDRIGKEKSGQQLIDRTRLKSYEVIRKIAAGQLLKGQFMHKNFEESSICRQQLIEVDSSIELMSPGISETMEILEFNSKEQSDKFESILRQSGISCAIGFYHGCFSLKSGVLGDGSFDKTNIEEEKSTSNLQKTFVKINQILHVPTASVTLSQQNVYLSSRALKSLKNLHSSPNFKDDCNLFFHEFGSHYYTGLCHFGGRYIWTVTSVAKSKENRSENYKSAKLALYGCLDGGFLWFGGQTKVSYENETEDVTKTRKFSENCKISKKLEKFGGPQEVDDISLWKKGLAEFNDTWMIIDKDISQKCYEGVWKLVECLTHEFVDAEAFSYQIFDEWEKLYNESADMTWSEPQLFLDYKLEANQKVHRKKYNTI